MTKDEALKLALEALEAYEIDNLYDIEDSVIAVIKEALAQPEQDGDFRPDWMNYQEGFAAGVLEGREQMKQTAPVQEPMHPELRKMWEDYFDKCFRAASQRTWVGLTKTAVGNHLRRHALGDQPTFKQGFKEGVTFAEAKLKEKNNG